MIGQDDPPIDIEGYIETQQPVRRTPSRAASSHEDPDPEGEVFFPDDMKDRRSQIEEATAPFQLALSARVGTDALGHLFRATSGLDPDAAIIAIDGVGAFDHILRREIFNGLLDDPNLSPLIPFVRLFYGGLS